MSALTLLLFDTAVATTRFVPTQYPTIQAAIWASSGADTIAVLPGTYVENIEIDRGVVIRSTGGPAVTVIDGSNPSDPDSASTVTMRAGTITGFDIRNGSGAFDDGFNEWWGGGVLATGSGIVRGNWIHDNVLIGYRGNGGGIRAEGNISVLQNRIYDNRVEAEQHGTCAGVSGSGLGVVVEGNEIFGNHVLNGGIGGAAGWCQFKHNVIACNTMIAGPISPLASGLFFTGTLAEGNTIVGNYASNDAAGLFVWGNDCVPPCPAEVFGNAVVFNVGGGLECDIDFAAVVHFGCNDIYGNSGTPLAGNCGTALGQDGNIAVDPEFGQGTCPHQHGHWCLGPDSPLLPENSPPGCGLIGALGECSQIGIADSPPHPGSLRGGPAVPNPFTERTTIPFYLAKESAVEIAIVDVLGRQIRKLDTGHMTVGDHAAQWDGRTQDGVRAASGAYIAVIRAAGVEVTQTLLLLR